MGDDSSDSNKQEKLPTISANGTNQIQLRSNVSSRAQSSRSEKPDIRQTREKEKPEQRKKKGEFLSSVSNTSINSELTTTPTTPWENYNVVARQSPSPDGHVENSLAFEGSKATNNSKDHRRKKSKSKEKKLTRRSPGRLSDTDGSDFELIDKLERVSAPYGVEESYHKIKQQVFEGVIVRYKGEGDEDDMDDPCHTEYYIRSLNPLHNRFEVVSRGVQTDLSDLQYVDHLEKKRKEKPVKKSQGTDSGLHDSENGGKKANALPVLNLPNKKVVKAVKNKRRPSTTTKLVELVDTEKQNAKAMEKRRPHSAKDKKSLENISTEETNVNTSDVNTNDVNDTNSKISLMNTPAILKYYREKTDETDLSPNLITEFSADDGLMDDVFPTDGLFSGPCQFCGNPIITILFDEEIEDPAQDELYCCPEYEYFIKLHLTAEDSDEMEDETRMLELIDINPPTQYASKKSKKDAIDNVVERMRKRELERQRNAAQQANVYTYGRQMKTIQFSLASPKTLEEGWTIQVRTPSPESPSKDDDTFQVEVNSTLLQKAEIMNERYYENGKKFLTIFPDGTGCCYYPNGNVAVLITSVEKGKYTYIVQSEKDYDDLKDYGILAVFEPFGNAICYYENNQRIRLYVNAHGGIELDRRGRKKKRWQWYFVKGHVHTPPFQPLCFPLNKYISIRVLDQHNIALIFTTQKRSIRFNVGSNLTAHGIRGFGTFEVDDSVDYLNIKKKELSTIIGKIHSVLRLPKALVSPTGDLILPPRKSKKLSPKESLPYIPSDLSVRVL